MENIRKELRFQNGFEVTWKWIITEMVNVILNRLEPKLNGMERNWNVIGMVISLQKRSMQNRLEMEWIWNDNGRNPNRKEIGWRDYGEQ